MKNFMFQLLTLGALLITFVLQSCNTDDNDAVINSTALVTVRPLADKGFSMQLDDNTTLYPSNLKTSPFGVKEVRALVNFRAETLANGKPVNVYVNWIDSIRTKQPVATAGADNDKFYGNDPIEIVKDWVTVAEDGYLTLRIRTRWGAAQPIHYVNLLTGTNPNNPYELELRHDARGDVNGRMGDALIAFNLNNLPKNNDKKVTIKLNWTSFTGKKSAEFSLSMHSAPIYTSREHATLNVCVK